MVCFFKNEEIDCNQWLFNVSLLNITIVYVFKGSENKSTFTNICYLPLFSLSSYDLC